MSPNVPALSSLVLLRDGAARTSILANEAHEF